ncbi:hypothetical protein RFI_08861 [Reticulomyxa filosa]|uniref:Sulfotransferase domain-containing protein n=1 Tax=Reticulomyxa filosa TaxID=46433 RepID=X6NQT0_RETFI|nr:hypothetical protein RFI_08861 [Reticulomyxa filosa]|eukprot:ETO28273.1 hypothetical protein RFI_08861 [Reticulomyxa filosa]
MVVYSASSIEKVSIVSPKSTITLMENRVENEPPKMKKSKKKRRSSLLPLPAEYKFRIFALVSNRVGTTTLFKFFSDNGVPSLHGNTKSTSEFVKMQYDLTPIVMDYLKHNKSRNSTSAKMLRLIYPRMQQLERLKGRTTRMIKAVDIMRYEWTMHPSTTTAYCNVLKAFQSIVFFSDISGAVSVSCAQQCLHFAKYLYFFVNKKSRIHIHDPLLHSYHRSKYHQHQHQHQHQQRRHNTHHGNNSSSAAVVDVLLQHMNRSYWLPLIEHISHFLPIIDPLPRSSSHAKCKKTTTTHKRLTFGARYWFEILDRTYGSEMKYILNIRPVKHWLLSKSDAFEHKYLLHQMRLCKFHKMTANNTLALHLAHFQWYWQWYHYICSTLHYFGKERLNRDIIVFDVESDHPSKLTGFFSSFGLVLNQTLYGHAHWSHSKQTHSKSREQFYQTSILPMIRTLPNEYDQIKLICGFPIS